MSSNSTPPSIETIIVPRARDLGEFEVRRALPAIERQMVGPFIFFDQMGPTEFLKGQAISVRPHPHIGLGTVTYLYDGIIRHRDSLGTNMDIEPGAVNWMVAGKGITHSERSPEESRQDTTPRPLFGIQTWLALPLKHEDSNPSFQHVGKDALPYLEDDGIALRLIMGRGWGKVSPVNTFSDMFYADVHLQANSKLPLPDDQEDRAIYILSGSVDIAGITYGAGRLLVFRPSDKITAKTTTEPARILCLGGETLEGDRHIWWNFVASSRERIEFAKEEWNRADWTNGHFQLPPNDNKDFIPLP